MFASQYRRGGPVIAVQVENEYGSFRNDKNYMEYIKKVRIVALHLYFYGFFLMLCLSEMHL